MKGKVVKIINTDPTQNIEVKQILGTTTLAPGQELTLHPDVTEVETKTV